ncbi:hypothetical protein [Thiocapsa bogorovii]|uniref:hypothetical protein n=1 Tax=Thiocapsa bogorovii TaxID=521689 RepID=UPI001E2B55D6|nr:hypothetical protein [Thiocapsa bogorovii]UHD17894.1 hypothetical protein LT988_07560 [Thiocapsa bogorovii]
MATAEQQASYKANDSKRLMQVRLSPEALAKLDRMVESRGAGGRAAVVEELLMGDAAPPAPSSPPRGPRGLFWP